MSHMVVLENVNLDVTMDAFLEIMKDTPPMKNKERFKVSMFQNTVDGEFRKIMCLCSKVGIEAAEQYVRAFNMAMGHKVSGNGWFSVENDMPYAMIDDC